ncbi:MAG: hypothetical protein ACAH35_04875 [Candidatus Paceibacterota bacterium]
MTKQIPSISETVPFPEKPSREMPDAEARQTIIGLSAAALAIPGWVANYYLFHSWALFWVLNILLIIAGFVCEFVYSQKAQPTVDAWTEYYQKKTEVGQQAARKAAKAPLPVIDWWVSSEGKFITVEYLNGENREAQKFEVGKVEKYHGPSPAVEFPGSTYQQQDNMWKWNRGDTIRLYDPSFEEHRTPVFDQDVLHAAEELRARLAVPVSHAAQAAALTIKDLLGSLTALLADGLAKEDGQKAVPILEGLKAYVVEQPDLLAQIEEIITLIRTTKQQGDMLEISQALSRLQENIRDHQAEVSARLEVVRDTQNA